jgi:hypothetical protein
MSEKKVVRVESTKEEPKKSGLNIDLGDLKKVGAAILAFVVANPDLVKKLVQKPAAYIKKIVKGEDVSKDTKKTINKTIKENKSGGLTSILGSLTSLGGGNSEINDIFGKISTAVTGAKVAEAAGVDVGGLLGGLLGGSSSKKTTTKKKSSSSSSGLGDVIKSLFK